MEKLSHNDHIDLYRHLAFCVVGGFFGGYAVLVHSGIMGNAQTVNLLELLMDFLRADGHGILLHTGALVIYILGTMSTVLLPHWLGADMHLVSPWITAAAAVMAAPAPADSQNRRPPMFHSAEPRAVEQATRGRLPSSPGRK